MKLGLTFDDVKRIIWTAIFAFLGTFLSLVAGAGDFHDFEEVKAAVLALIPAAIAAAFSAVKNGVLSDTNPVK